MARQECWRLRLARVRYLFDISDLPFGFLAELINEREDLFRGCHTEIGVRHSVAGSCP